ncbi:ribonuclease M5 [Lacticaseibacillus zeae]|uniref:Ribonuclease M5 n=1 Tax=Lacticaseibacillus zeae subsp. silagei TaxID=3068307 RepID=A0ABD7Z888_LACZE|nr:MULTISPECIES: ribonuclease M5 [Lacticaseibacillus]MDE3316463.1 ribonuclease M5 [Lacticaseibacillus zeae]OFR96864.1 ribonuclease M5 [Lactobacillus sp. HMSC068F07]WLV83262.1 ribonuclease M5 [Lacticaseibacillus sp. NCIMB 15475]WLV86011.1 ribonuclease M5 [Lacticaseibacillus sp. NCIMB 15474]
MTTIKQIVVVEGRDDTKRLKETFGDIDTIETRGSAIDDATLVRIRQAQAKRGVIVLTDPDFPGEKIRKTISRAVPGVTHAFLPRAEGIPAHKGSLGIEHATPAALRAALQHLFTEVPDAPQVISQHDLLAAHLIGGAGSRHRREQLGELLHIGYTNGKQLLRRLTEFRISRAAFFAALDQVNGGQDDHA